MAYLSISSQGRRPRRWDLTDTVVLGRTVWCDIKFDDPGLSKQHCRLDKNGDSWYVADLESANGTFVNDEPVLRRQLAPGDQLRIGGVVIGFCAPVPSAASHSRAPAQFSRRETDGSDTVVGISAGIALAEDAPQHVSEAWETSFAGPALAEPAAPTLPRTPPIRVPPPSAAPGIDEPTEPTLDAPDIGFATDGRSYSAPSTALRASQELRRPEPSSPEPSLDAPELVALAFQDQTIPAAAYSPLPSSSDQTPLGHSIDPWQKASQLAHAAIAPPEPVAVNVTAEAEDRLRQLKEELLEQWREAVAEEDSERAIEALKDLAEHLTPEEARAMEPDARAMFKHRRRKLGLSFTLAIESHDFRDALRIGQTILDEYPNSRMAGEIKGKLDDLAQKAADQEAHEQTLVVPETAGVSETLVDSASVVPTSPVPLALAESKPTGRRSNDWIKDPDADKEIQYGNTNVTVQVSKEPLIDLESWRAMLLSPLGKKVAAGLAAAVLIVVVSRAIFHPNRISNPTPEQARAWTTQSKDD